MPWILSGRASQRKHDDVDIAVKERDMPLVRAWLSNQDFYDKALDSFELECNVKNLDFGMHAFIEDTLVSFVPYVIEGQSFTQRNALHKVFAGYDALIVAETKNLREDDCVQRSALPSGQLIGTGTAEAVKAAKVSTNREKDLIDIAEIDRMGYDPLRYARVLAAFEAMRVYCPAYSE